MTEAGEWERWEAIVDPILEASPNLSEPELGGLTEQIVDGIVQQTRADREHVANSEMIRREATLEPLKLEVDRAEAEVTELKAWRRSAWALLTAVASSGVEHEDSRLDYLTVQIDRGTWDALELYRLRPKQFTGDDEDVAEAMASVRRGELPEDSEERDHPRAENAALTARLRAANATTRAAQERADRAEAALRQRNEP